MLKIMNPNLLTTRYETEGFLRGSHHMIFSEGGDVIEEWPEAMIKEAYVN